MGAGDKESAGVRLLSSSGEEYTANSGTSINITTATAINIKSSAGIVKKVIVNSNTGGSFQLIDSTVAGTYIGSIGGTYTPTTATSSVIPIEIEFSRGISIITAGTVNLTVVYK